MTNINEKEAVLLTLLLNRHFKTLALQYYNDGVIRKESLS